MRFAVIFAAMLLCACATRPGDSVVYYKGVYAPGSVQIAADGAFISRASVWDAANREVAGEAALHRLEQTARARGYSHFLLDGSHKEDAFGHQYVLNGTLYLAADAPPEALPMDEMRYALQPDPVEAVIAAAGQPEIPARAEPAAAAPVHEPRDLLGDEPADGEEPVVIEAPEFITMKPTKRPWG